MARSSEKVTVHWKSLFGTGRTPIRMFLRKRLLWHCDSECDFSFKQRLRSHYVRPYLQWEHFSNLGSIILARPMAHSVL